MGIGIKELVVILLIVILVFGTKKIRNVGADVGGWIRDFRKSVKDGNDEPPMVDATAGKRVIDGEAVTQGAEQKNS